MAAIAEEEQSRREPHMSSFGPENSHESIQSPAALQVDHDLSHQEGSARTDEAHAGEEPLTTTDNLTCNTDLLIVANGEVDLPLRHPATETLPNAVYISENDKNVYLPCHYFDLIAGTSTGG
jgi:hypothetical protein